MIKVKRAGGGAGPPVQQQRAAGHRLPALRQRAGPAQPRHAERVCTADHPGGRSVNASLRQWVELQKCCHFCAALADSTQCLSQAYVINMLQGCNDNKGAARGRVCMLDRPDSMQALKHQHALSDSLLEAPRCWRMAWFWARHCAWLLSLTGRRCTQSATKRSRFASTLLLNKAIKADTGRAQCPEWRGMIFSQFSQPSLSCTFAQACATLQSIISTFLLWSLD